ncbi:MAG TPA: hypothetical protein VM533_11095 [Fimbriiglobus sp.]|jgi:hypothetical protein|nr:hypothetical protein [Fimbriiglobus sp.]
MTGRQAAVLAAPALVVLIALPFGTTHVVSAAVAVGLTVPVAFGTFWLNRWMADRHPLGGVVGMLVGTVLRLAVAFAGGAAAFLLAPDLRSAGLIFWLWLLFAYLSSLLAETALLVGQSPLAAGGASGGKG